MGIIVVNSTVAARREMAVDGLISPIHFWGYPPTNGDTLLCNRRNRYEIVFRHRVCKGTDLRVLFQTLWRLKRGASGLYLVTQPDLMRALPLLKRMFPNKPIATWAWTPREVRSNARYLQFADHVFSLTTAGVAELEKIGLTGRCSLGLWGCDPAFYKLVESAVPPVVNDLLFFGLVSRDVDLIRRLAGHGKFTIATSKRSIAVVGAGLGLNQVDADSNSDLVRAIHSSHVSLVPLKANEPEPTGFTNLIESLLCGTSVVITSDSIIPDEALNLPGVHRYRAGDLESFRNACQVAVTSNKAPGRRNEIQKAASLVLNGKKLYSEIRRKLAVSQ
jgi:hypothetical protein